MYRTCQLIVWLYTPPGSPKANTYCQRPAGHEGKCSAEPLAEDLLCKDEGCPHYGTPHVCVEKGESK